MSLTIPVLVRVVSPDGRPVEEAFLSFEVCNPPLPEMVLVTNSQGETRMSLPLGTYRLAARKREMRGAVDFVIDSKATPKRLTIVLSDAGPV